MRVYAIELRNPTTNEIVVKYTGIFRNIFLAVCDAECRFKDPLLLEAKELKIQKRRY